MAPNRGHYNKVPKFIVNFSNKVTIHYDLDSSVLALDNWMKEIVKYDPSDLCDINYKVCPSSKELIEEKIKKLYELADILNSVYSGAIVKEEFFKGNENDILNRMHIHFPIINDESSHAKTINHYASKYNALIHSLEKDFSLVKDHTLFNIAIDIHQSPKGFVKHKLDAEDYKKFKPFNPFGSLVLGYPHVGRTAQELFFSRDLVCPKDQYVPQTDISASCRMIFGSYVFPSLSESREKHEKVYLENWKKFYTNRGGKGFFECDIDSPDIRFGSLRIGALCYATVGKETIDFQLLGDLLKLRRALLANDIMSFTIEK